MARNEKITQLLSNVSLSWVLSVFILFSGFTALILLHNFSLPNYCFCHPCGLLYAEKHIFNGQTRIHIYNGIVINSLF